MKKLIGRAFNAGLALNALLTRSGPLRFVEGLVVTPAFVRLTRLVRGRAATPVARTPEALGREWERLLGNTKFARVTEVDAANGVAYGEITANCPLRGSGDVQACHRLMAYDRALLAPHGARFEVLSSQAEPGRTSCRVAIRV